MNLKNEIGNETKSKSTVLKSFGKNYRRIIAFLMAFLLILPNVTEVGTVIAQAAENKIATVGNTQTTTNETVTVETATTRTYQSGTLRIHYTIKSQWTNHQAVEIILENTGSESITNWAIQIDNTGNISGLWNATMQFHDEETYIIKSQSYNSTILPGETINFGYTLEGENITLPETISRYTAKEEIKDGYRIEYQKTGDWATGFQAEIIITNESDKAMEDWSLNINGNFTIEDIWNCETH